MAKIIKTIQNLKPGKQYLLAVKPKDADLNTVYDPTSAIRFVVPSDATQPQALGNLVIVGNYKSIMISFNPSNEADLRGYNYEVYLPESIQQSGSSYVVIPGQTPYLSGFSASNVITLDVPLNTESTNTVNSNTGVTTTTTTEKLYFARVQSIDTSGNQSSWTSIVASSATTLIDSAHIINLTASKITAGTIGAHTITLAGATSIIKSSTFDGVDVGGGSYANASTGWLINGSGRAYFYDATIAGSIDIGGFDSGSFHVDSEGNLWLGSGTLVNAPFKVLKEGDVTAKTLTLTGTTELSTDPSSTAKIYLGNGNYNNIDTPFYVDNTSQFSLGDKLFWDGASLTIQGTLRFPDGSEPPDEDDVNEAVDGVKGEIQNGFIGGLTISSTKMHYGAGNFANNDTAFFVGKNESNQANFSLGDKLTWDGSTLSVTGSVVITAGATKEAIDNAQETADEAQDDANTAYSTAIDARGIAITAETKADEAQDDADTAYSTAIDARSIAITAQSTADGASNLASTKITAGGAAFDINNNSTTITGNKVTTGTLAAENGASWIDLNSGHFAFGNGKIYWQGANLIIGPATTFYGEINVNNEFRVDPNGTVQCRNITVDDGLAYRGVNFASSGDTTTARINQLSGVQRIVQPNSTRDIKKNIEDISGALEIVNALRPRTFNFNEVYYGEIDPSTNEPWTSQARELHELFSSYGFIVEEVQEVNPQLVSYAPAELGSFDISTWRPKMWKDLEIIALLTKAVQELSDQVEELESRLYDAPQ